VKRLELDFNILNTMDKSQKEFALALMQRMEYTEKKKNEVQEIIVNLIEDLNIGK
jgi:hypothetical protein